VLPKRYAAPKRCYPKWAHGARAPLRKALVRLLYEFENGGAAPKSVLFLRPCPGVVRHPRRRPIGPIRGREIRGAPGPAEFWKLSKVLGLAVLVRAVLFAWCSGRPARGPLAGWLGVLAPVPHFPGIGAFPVLRLRRGVGAF
jgi:hypothetical protein